MEKNKDKISVIIPCYNVQKYVMRCFDSIYSQTYGFENLEVIFIDDLSIDNTWSILEMLQNKYSENVISVKMENKGMCGGTRNLGMDICTGKYIMFLDADDCIHPNTIDILYNKCLEKDFDIVQCEVVMFCDDKPKYTQIEDVKAREFNLANIDERKELILAWSGGFSICVWAKLYSSEFLKKNCIRFIENINYEDGHFSFLCVLLAKKYCKIDSPLLYYFQNSNGIMAGQQSLEKLRDSAKYTNILIEEIKHRGLDNGVVKECKYEVQIAIFWRFYFCTINKLNWIYQEEKKFYRDFVLKNNFFEGILSSPYIKETIGEEFLNYMSYLKEGI